jgi:hypothetical protein
MNKNIFIRYIFIAIFLILAILVLIKFSLPAILQFYVTGSVNGCREQPIFCNVPDEVITHKIIDKEYLSNLVCFKLPEVSICAPKEFTVIKEQLTKAYYKRVKNPDTDSIIYLVYEKPNFFMGLFPQLKKQGINNDFEFIKRVMFANLKDIKDLNSAFFVIMKGIFTPDLGEQNTVRMAQFILNDKKGFLNYNLTNQYNYFDCNIINSKGDFFKIYIKDRFTRLSLENVLAIISTVAKTGS